MYRTKTNVVGFKSIVLQILIVEVASRAAPRRAQLKARRGRDEPQKKKIKVDNSS